MPRRKTPFIVHMIRLAFRILGTLSPRLAARWMYKIWFQSPRFNEPRREQQWREQASADFIQRPHGKVAVYRWGEENKPLVFLLHGWSGRAAQLGAFVQPLNDAGYQVLSFDAPGHGYSDGKATTLFEIAESLNDISKQYGQAQHIVAHSFGCMVSAYAIRNYNLKVNSFVSISNPGTVQYLIDVFTETLNINNRTKKLFIDKFKTRFGSDLFEVADANYNLKNTTLPILAVHDKNDYDVIWQCTDKFVNGLNNVTTLYTEKLGHRRILRDAETINTIVSFIEEHSS